MKKVIRSRIFLLAILCMLLISAFSFIAYAKSRAVCSEAEECCLQTDPNSSNEMLWDVLSRQFVSVIYF